MMVYTCRRLQHEGQPVPLQVHGWTGSEGWLLQSELMEGVLPLIFGLEVEHSVS